MEHELKTWPEYFQAIARGEKPFEIRKNDRNFKVRDTLSLLEYDPENRVYTGDIIKAKITYILEGGQFGIEKGYVVLGIRITARIGTDPAKGPDTVVAMLVTPEKENPSPPETLEDKVNNLERKLDTVWSEIFSGGVGCISKNDHRFRTTLKGTVDNLCAHAGMSPVQSPWSQKKETIV